MLLFEGPVCVDERVSVRNGVRNDTYHGFLMPQLPCGKAQRLLFAEACPAPAVQKQTFPGYGDYLLYVMK